jgi:hypothetical protein
MENTDRQEGESDEVTARRKLFCDRTIEIVVNFRSASSSVS